MEDVPLEWILPEDRATAVKVGQAVQARFAYEGRERVWKGSGKGDIGASYGARCGASSET